MPAGGVCGSGEGPPGVGDARTERTRPESDGSGPAASPPCVATGCIAAGSGTAGCVATGSFATSLAGASATGGDCCLPCSFGRCGRRKTPSKGVRTKMGALDGLRVLDFGRYVAGPYCATLLGEFGADVIRIEKTDGSEDRFVAPVTDEGEGALFLQMICNKRSLTLDPATPLDGRSFDAWCRPPISWSSICRPSPSPPWGWTTRRCGRSKGTLSSSAFPPSAQSWQRGSCTRWR